MGSELCGDITTHPPIHTHMHLYTPIRMHTHVYCRQSPKPADKGFMEVRGPRVGDATYDAPGLELTNKYSALDNN